MRFNAIDDLVMLLSSDWFFPLWKSIGLEVDERVRQTIQQGCRVVVKEIIGTAKDYRRVSFSEERLHQTRRSFEAVVAKSGVTDVDRRELFALMASDSDANRNAWSFLHLSEMIAHEAPEARSVSLDPAIVKRVAILCRTWDEVEVCCDELDETSATQWDTYLRNLTPEIPARLCHYLQEDIINQRQFEILRSFVNRGLSPVQRTELLEAYRALAKTLGMDPPNGFNL